MRDMISEEEFFAGLSKRAKNALEYFGAKSTSQVFAMSLDQIQGIPNCGNTTTKEIVNAVAVANGVSFEWAWPRVNSHSHLPLTIAILAKSSTFSEPERSPFGYQNCATCRFWERWKDEEFHDIGCCVRHAPIPVIDPSDDASDPTATWPTTTKNSRCGEWRFNG